MNGVLILDKPCGATSHDIVRRVRRVLGTRRVGHAGTLDPLASGVLQVAVGEGTKLVQFLMAEDKSYRATVKLGEVTDTQDAEGRVIEEFPVGEISRRQLEAVCGELTGTIAQLPPMYSALKKNGVPLHRLARRGVEVERETREVRIDRFEIVELRLPFVTFEVDCSKGTYVRTLAHDLGLRLGTGGHLTALRRTRTGSFSVRESISLAQLEEAEDPRMLPGFLSLRQAVRDYPALEVGDRAFGPLGNGIPPQLDEVQGGSLPREGELVALVRRERLLALARAAPSRHREKRGDFELLRVFPDRGGP